LRHGLHATPAITSDMILEQQDANWAV